MTFKRSFKSLLALREENEELLQLERRKKRLKAQLDETEADILLYLKRHPRARRLLAAVRAVNLRKNHQKPL